MNIWITIKAFEHGIIDRYAKCDNSILVDKSDLIIVWDGARAGLTGKGCNGILGSTLKKLTRKPEFEKHLYLICIMHFNHIINILIIMGAAL